MDLEDPLSQSQSLEVPHKDFLLGSLEMASHRSAWSEDLLELVVVEDASMWVLLVLLEVWEGLQWVVEEDGSESLE